VNKLIKSLIVAVMFLVGSIAFAADENKGYSVLSPAQPTSNKQIEVLEFFFYGCSHCFDLHAHLGPWAKKLPKDVKLTYVPTVFRDSWEASARAYYALESMGQAEEMGDVLYWAWNVEKKNLYDETAVKDVLVSHGVDSGKFYGAYNAFSMQSKIARAKLMIRTYGVSGTPTLVVAGKYVISGLQPQATIKVLDEVIEMVRKERSK
jgi:thiol:disulfide interchange protein DsbA